MSSPVRRLASALLVVALAFGMAACGDEKEPAVTGDPATTTATTAAP